MLFSFLKAQIHNDVSIGYQSVYGTPVGKIKGDVSNYVSGHSVSFSKNLEQSEQEWVKFLHAKSVNINLTFLNMNYTETNRIGRPFKFGDGYSISTNVDFKLADFGKFQFLLSPSVGLIYVTKTVHTDPDTYYFGSHINAVFNGGIGFNYDFSKDYSLTSKVSFLHFSNGGVKIPNAGINMLTAELGIQKHFFTNTNENQTLRPEKDFKKNALEIGVGAGQRGKYKINEAFYRIDVNTAYSHFINKTLGFKIGLDGVYYNQVFNPLIYDDSVPYWGKSYKHWRLGANIGTEVKMNKISANYSFGRYLYFKSPYDQKTYWKAGLRYYILPKFGLEAQMYAHKVQADFLSFGLFTRF